MRKLADFLQTKVKPKWFDLGQWATDGFTKKECGSTACALGWATVAFPRSGLSLVPDNQGWYENLQVRFHNKSGRASFDFNAARKFFGISRDMAYHLFDPDAYFDGTETGGSKKDVIKRLRFVASTGQMEPDEDG